MFFATAEARTALAHFLDNTGTPVELEVNKILQKSPLARSNWTTAIQDLIAYVDTTKFVGTVELVDRVSHLGNTVDSDYAWAVGEYTGWSKARITSTLVNDSFEYDVEYVYQMWDPWDWNPNSPEIADPILARMHLVGYCKQYMTEGVHGVTLSWRKGSPPQVPSP